jgi:hypothetical protein
MTFYLRFLFLMFQMFRSKMNLLKTLKNSFFIFILCLISFGSLISIQKVSSNMHENDIYNNGKRMNLLKLLVDYNRLKSHSNEVKFKKPKHDFELLVSKKRF